MRQILPSVSSAKVALALVLVACAESPSAVPMSNGPPPNPDAAMVGAAGTPSEVNRGEEDILIAEPVFGGMPTNTIQDVLLGYDARRDLSVAFLVRRFGTLPKGKIEIPSRNVAMLSASSHVWIARGKRTECSTEATDCWRDQVDVRITAATGFFDWEARQVDLTLALDPAGATAEGWPRTLRFDNVP